MKVYLGFRLTRHNLHNGDRAVPGLRLRLGELARHDSFLIRVVLGHTPEGMSPVRLGLARHNPLVGYRCR
jgi:hypothetical protein